MRIAFDTNIIAYVAGARRSSADPAKIVRAREVVAKLSEEHDLIVPMQALGELYNVLVKDGKIEERPKLVISSLYSRGDTSLG